MLVMSSVDIELEEGEVLDEDFEDVSDDNSSLILLTGKSSSFAGLEPFRELSLTSVSDYSDEIEHKYNSTLRAIHERRRCVRRRSPPRRAERTRTKKARYRSPSSSSSRGGAGDYINTLRQLQNAGRIVNDTSPTRMRNNCSLRSRLKRMIAPKSSEDELDTLRAQALQSKSVKTTTTQCDETTTEEDLNQLRLMALRSAYIKKAEIRRKRKEEERRKFEETDRKNEVILKEIQQQVTELVPDLNDELMELVDCDEETVEEAAAVNELEDKDAIAEENDVIEEDRDKAAIEEEKVAIEEDKVAIEEDKDQVEFVDVIHFIDEHIIEDEKDEIPVENPPVNNNNNDNKDAIIPLDEDTDEIIPVVENKLVKSPTVEEDEDILRAMLLTSIAKKISSTKPSTIEPKKSPKLPKTPPRLPMAPVNRLVINVNSDSDSECEPKASTDVFNHHLSVFLKQARAKSEKSTNDTIAKHLPKSQQIEYRFLKRKLQQLSSRAQCKKQKGPELLQQQTVVTPAGRLQMKGKYEELTALMARVSEAQIAREKAHTEVKRLINDLRIARANFSTTHRNYTKLIRELVDSKQSIDKRSEEQRLQNESPNPVICTSTPNKTVVPEIPCELSTIEPATTTEDITNVDKVPLTVVETEKEPPVERETFLKYSSPLDHLQLNSISAAEALLVLCPYDLCGECRDPDCIYRHFDTNKPPIES